HHGELDTLGNQRVGQQRADHSGGAGDEQTGRDWKTSVDESVSGVTPNATDQVRAPRLPRSVSRRRTGRRPQGQRGLRWRLVKVAYIDPQLGCRRGNRADKRCTIDLTPRAAPPWA